MLLNCPIRCIMPILNIPPVIADNDDEHWETLVQRQLKADKNCDTLRNYNYIPVGTSIAVQREDGGPWAHGTIVDKGNKAIMTDYTEYE